jgi:glyoxylase-like metal-dependent hydrolase (beta-lactamase superfamily II)/rhodanese-related sulfurtransferase
VPIKQFYLGCLAHASYLVWDERSKKAAVVDPQRDIDDYISEARALGLEISHVLLTHFHADFVSGHLELAMRCGAAIAMGSKARAGYAFTPLSDGAELALGGSTKLRVLETPGHTPEAVCYVVLEDGKPAAVLTGDTLFIGDVGRPDLMASKGVTAQQLAAQLYDSLRQKLMPLPDETLVYPAHGAGSFCGKNMSSDIVSTLGDQKKGNYALQPMDRSAFIALVTADQPEAPAYFAYDAELNRSDRPILEEELAKLKPLSAEELKAFKGTVLDTRDPAAYAAAHVRGAVNIGLSGKFATWAGTVLDRSRPILIVAAPGSERGAALRLGRIGLEASGYFQMESLRGREDLVVSNPRLTAEEFKAFKGAVLDVRTPSEREAGHVKGSIHIPLNQLKERLTEVPRGPLAIYCAGGYRSSIAVSLLEKAGRSDVSDLIGGYASLSAKA